jgi:hypothetical protein
LLQFNICKSKMMNIRSGAWTVNPSWKGTSSFPLKLTETSVEGMQ